MPLAEARGQSHVLSAAGPLRVAAARRGKLSPNLVRPAVSGAVAAQTSRGRARPAVVERGRRRYGVLPGGADRSESFRNCTTAGARASARAWIERCPSLLTT